MPGSGYKTWQEQEPLFVRLLTIVACDFVHMTHILIMNQTHYKNLDQCYAAMPKANSYHSFKDIYRINSESAFVM
eukprot:5652983-Amphidinium_carterae.1